MTIDAYPGLTPLERHVKFVESLFGPITTLRYQELLKLHFNKNSNVRTKSRL